MKAWASRQRDPFLQFAANPEFDETFDDDTGKLMLASHLENYTVDTMPAEHPDAMVEYREFLDSYTRLNTLLSGRHLPPEPRLRLNAVLARRKVVPIKVELTRCRRRAASRRTRLHMAIVAGRPKANRRSPSEL